MSEKKLTPIQQFAEWYNQYCKDYDMYPNEWEVNKKLESIFPIERKAIEDAVWFGHDNKPDMIHVPESFATDYFEQTYKTEK